MEVEAKYVMRRVIALMLLMSGCGYGGYQLGHGIGYKQGKEEVVKYIQTKLKDDKEPKSSI